MSKLNITLPDEQERRLRIKIAERGGKKGAVSEAVSEAIELWLERHRGD